MKQIKEKSLAAIVVGCAMSVAAISGCSESARQSFYRDPDSDLVRQRWFNAKTGNYESFEAERRRERLPFIPPKEERNRNQHNRNHYWNNSGDSHMQSPRPYQHNQQQYQHNYQRSQYHQPPPCHDTHQYLRMPNQMHTPQQRNCCMSKRR